MDAILGQPRALQVLRAARRSRRMHHGWIFAGPRGVGKFTTAIELAKVLLDPHGDEQAAARGETARLVDARAHPDLHVITKELALYSADPAVRGRKLTNIPIDVLREHVIGGEVGGRTFDAPVYLRAALGRGKVFIIDEAELLDRVGYSALLKTLEEPPPRTYLVLVTSRLQRLPPTVLSRCQVVTFGRLDEAAMEQWMQRRAADVPPEARAWVLDFAQGSPGMAELALTHDFHAWHRRLEPMLAQLAAGRFPASMGATMAELIEAYAAAVVKGQDNASKDAANKDGTRHLLSILSAHADRGLRQAVASGRDTAPWRTAIDLIAQAEAQGLSNLNLKLVLENLVAQWASTAAPAA